MTRSTACRHHPALCSWVIVLLFAPDAVVSEREEGTCGVAWRSFQHSCYKLHLEPKTWRDARDTCVRQRGELVTILSAREQQFVYRTFAVGSSRWIGLRRNLQGVFHWVGELPVVYRNWIQPPGSDPNAPEQCGEMTDYGSFHGMWNDLSCDSRLPFICEKGFPLSHAYQVSRGKRLQGSAILNMRTASDMECLMRCQRMRWCQSINFRAQSGSSAGGLGRCELNDDNAEAASERFSEVDHWSYYFEVV